MSLWNTRAEALAHPELAELNILIESGFTVVDEGLRLLEARADDDLSRLSGVFLLKAKNLALGCYSLVLDGLAQEAGALLRPLLEALFVVKYLRTIPEGLQRIKEGRRLPDAGKMAAIVGDSFQDLRQHLSNNASHVRLEFDALQHLVDFEDDGTALKVILRTTQPFILKAARTNSIITGAVMKQLLDELLQCIDAVYGGCPVDLIEKADSFRRILLSFTM